MNTPSSNGSDWVVIVGPTAVGKTEVAVELALLLNGEIISADSMQVYRHMNIGTAKPPIQERRGVAFHLIDVARPDEPFTAARWKSEAERAAAQISAGGRRPIICGGTGLYIRALLEDWNMAGTPADPELRGRLTAMAEQNGSAELHRELQAVDPHTAARLHPNDAVRIVRALEVYYLTGCTIADRQRGDQNRKQGRAARQYGLTRPRSELYDRIDHRVDCMLSEGLEAETRWLLEHGYSTDLAAMRSLGYKEMNQKIQGELDETETAQAIKQNTRRYAKRQLTWFRADRTIEWIEFSQLGPAGVAGEIMNSLNQQTLG